VLGDGVQNIMNDCHAKEHPEHAQLILMGKIYEKFKATKEPANESKKEK